MHGGTPRRAYGSCRDTLCAPTCQCRASRYDGRSEHLTWVGYPSWFGQAASVRFTIIGIGFQSPRSIVIAAALSGVFSIMAMFSIGIVILPICLAQLGLAWAMHRAETREHQLPAR